VEDVFDCDASLKSDKIGKFNAFDDDVIKLVSEFDGCGVELR
jgi:hypothetical protein